MMKSFIGKTGYALMVSSLLLMSLTLSACGGVSAPAAGGDATAAVNPAAAAPVEKPEDLYALAKKEGKVVVYSTSGRANDVKKSFEAKYPGVTVEVFKIKSNDMLDKLTREQDAGLYNADVIITKEVSGAVEEEMVKPGRIYKYLPEDIAQHVEEPFKTQSPGYANYVEMRSLYYNTEAYAKAPITNWWDLTTPEWKGKVYMADPLSSPAFMDLFTAMTVNSDDMKKAYKDKFGKEIELTGTENAGYEFIKRLMANGLIVLKGSGDVLEAIGKAGTKSPAVGIAVSGDMSTVEEEGLKVAPMFDVLPKASVPDAGYLYMVNKAPHENAGKLLMRWMMGEADGKAEGLTPFNQLGAWVPRTDVKTVNAFPFEQLNMWAYDTQAFYKNSAKVRDFWIKQK